MGIKPPTLDNPFGLGNLPDDMTLLEKYIGTAYDVVKKVYDNLGMLRQLAVIMYPTIEAGLAATIDGQYFTVPAGDPDEDDLYTLYQNVDGEEVVQGQSLTINGILEFLSDHSIVPVENVAALSSLVPTSKTVAYLRGYETPNDGGQGILIWDPTDNTNLTTDPTKINKFAGPGGPAVIGRYSRPNDGIFHTKWHGIKHDLSRDESQRMQDMARICANEGFTFHIDPAVDGSAGSGIDCAGGVIFFNKLGTNASHISNSVSGIKVEGSSRRISQVRNAIFSVGIVGAQGGDGLATGRHVLRDFYITGGIDLWSLETSSRVDGVTLIPLPICTDTFGMNVFFCNHLDLQDTRVEGGMLNGNMLNGYRFTGSQNTTMFKGGGAQNVVHCAIGEAMGNPTYGPEGLVLPNDASIASLVPQIDFVGAHFESNVREIFRARRFSNINIIDCHLRGQVPTWDNEHYDLMKFGTNEDVVAQSNVRIVGNYLVSNTADLPGAFININRCSFVFIDQNKFTNISTAIKTSQSVSDVLQIGRTNSFQNVANQVQKDNGTSIAREHPSMTNPVLVTDVASISLDANFGRLFELDLFGTNRTFNWLNLEYSQTYTLVIRKRADAASIANTAYALGGRLAQGMSIPDLSTVATGDAVLLRFCTTNSLDVGTIPEAWLTSIQVYAGPH